jgi:hypothetical protein
VTVPLEQQNIPLESVRFFLDDQDTRVAPARTTCP